MNTILKFEFKRAFLSPYFIGALIIGCLITISHFIFSVLPATHWLDIYLLGKGDYPSSVFNTWIEMDGSSIQLRMFTMMLPLLASMPYGDSLYQDSKDGYMNNIVTRIEKKAYLIAKLIASFIAGGIVVIIPVIMNLYLTSLIIPTLIPEPTAMTFPISSRNMWCELFYSNPLLYIVCFLIIIFMYAGIFSIMGLALSTYVKNRFAILVFSFIAVYFISYILEYLAIVFERYELLNFLPYNFLRLDQPGKNSFVAIILEGFLILACTLIIYFRKEEKNETI